MEAGIRQDRRGQLDFLSQVADPGDFLRRFQMPEVQFIDGDFLPTETRIGMAQ